MPSLRSLICCCLLFPVIAISQQAASWSVPLGTAVDWYYQSKFGLLIYCNKEGLHALDPSQQKIVWSNPAFKNIKSEQFFEPKDIPLMMVWDLPTKKKPKLLQSGEKRSLLLDPLTGKTLFDTELIAMDRITKSGVLPGINAMWVEGYVEQNRMMAVVDIGEQKTRFIKEKPVKLAKISFVDILKPVVDPEGNILFSYGGRFFRINSSTGNTIWEKDYTMGCMFFTPNGKNLLGFNSSLAAYDLATGNYLYGDTSRIRQDPDSSIAAIQQDMRSTDTVFSPEKVLELPGKWEMKKDAFLMSGGMVANSFNYFDYYTLKGKW